MNASVEGTGADGLAAPHPARAWWRKAHSLKVEIALGFGLVIALMLALGIGFYLSEQRSVAAVNKLLKSDVRMADLSLRSANAMLRARHAESDFVLSAERIGVIDARERYMLVMQSNLLDMREYLTSMRVISSDPELLEKIRRIEIEAWRYENGFLSFVEHYTKTGKEALTYAEPSYVDAALIIEALLEDLHTGATKQEVKTRNGVERAVQLTRWTVFVTVAIATMLAMAAAVVLSRRINGSVSHLIAFSRRVALGDFSARAQHDSEHEFAILARAMNQMAESIESSHALLTETQHQLVTAARRAGMAEIANNVLHNVGNVLNSVNVSASLISTGIHNSKVQGLGRAVGLMNEHAVDLGYFLSADAKGKLLPGYLNTLVAALEEEQRSALEEIDRLRTSIDHIKDIVASQQTFAGTASLIESVLVGDLLEDALRMNADALARHQVTVVKDFGGLPMLQLDKHRLLQILVNLIANARQALADVCERERRIVLHADIAGAGGERRLCIRVEDDGEGIAPEHMAHLFVHGFTTRKNGHGFGLHSCVLAAREMGGTLSAHSDGPGKGAVFTLELPIQAELSV